MAEANGTGHVDAADDAVVEAPAPAAAAAAPAEPAEPEQEPVRIPKGLYFVRVPRPEFDESTTKNLQQAVSDQIAKLKNINGKMQIKRGEVGAVRKQLADARAIRDGSKQDYETKMARIKELQDMRRSYTDQISDIRGSQKGLEVRSEQDLDARIDELEAEIASGAAPLRVERQLVQNIAKLQSQRDRVREFQAAQGDLGELEGHLQRVKAMLAELQDEFKIISGERDQVKAIITDLQAKHTALSDGLSYLEGERAEVEAHKAELQEQLRAAREDIDAALGAYRENRKLSLQLRDLVDAGQLEEAAGLAAQQVETYMAKLAADPAYRTEYTTLWRAQRKYVVSEVLPESGAAAPAPAAAAATPGGKGGGAARAPAVPQGAAKAQAAIAAALAAADTELAAVRAAAPAAQQALPGASEDDDDDDDGPAQEQPAAPATPAADRQRRLVPGAPDELLAAHKPARPHKPEPLVAPPVTHTVNYEFVLPVTQRDDKDKEEQLSAAELKDRVREENRRKAAEAEERKKKRSDAAAKKRQKAEEAAQRHEAEAAARAARAHAIAAAAAAAAAEEAAAAARAAVPSGTDGEGEEGSSPAAGGAAAGGGGGGGGSSAVHKRGSQLASASKAAPARPPPRRAKKQPVLWEEPGRWAQAHSKELGVALFVVFLLLLGLLAMWRSG